MNAYHSHFPISPPEEDLDARLALYSLRRYQPISMVANVGKPANDNIQLPARKHTFRVGHQTQTRVYLLYTSKQRHRTVADHSQADC